MKAKPILHAFAALLVAASGAYSQVSSSQPVPVTLDRNTRVSNVAAKGYLLKQTATAPATPGAGFSVIWPKTDGTLHLLTASGDIEIGSGGGGGSFQPLAADLTNFVAKASVGSNGVTIFDVDAAVSGDLLKLTQNGVTQFVVRGDDTAQFQGNLTANSFIGNGGSLTSLNASNLGSGTVPIARLTFAEATVSSASTTNIGAATSMNVQVTGTTTITAFDNVAAGIFRQGRFAGALTLQHNGTSLILPGGANITTAANDRFAALSLGSGNWIVTDYQKADGTALVGAAGGGDASTNTSVSVDGEMAVYSGTGGKTLKRMTGTGMVKMASGVPTAATAGTDYVAPTGSGSGLTSLNASQITSGTLPDARLNSKLQSFITASSFSGGILTLTDTPLFLSKNGAASGQQLFGIEVAASTIFDLLDNGNLTIGGTLAAPNTSTTGINISAGASVTTANAMAALAVDVTKFNNTKSISSNSTLTFSTTPATAQTWFAIALTNSDTNPHTITIPSSYSIAKQAAITSFVIPASGFAQLVWKYTGSRYELTGETPYLDNMAGTAAPTANEDSADGFGPGSFWLDTTNHRLWVCESASAGAAVWRALDNLAFDSDADGKVDVLDLAAAGYVAVDASGNVTGSRTLVAGTGIGITNTTGGGNPTFSFDATGVTNATWAAASAGSFTWTWNVTGTDPGLTFGNATIVVNNAELRGSSTNFGQYEVGGAGTTDTTIERAAAGIISVEGIRVPTASSVDTFSNKTEDFGTSMGTDDTLVGVTRSGRNNTGGVTQWDAVYLNSSSQWALADANGSGTYPCRGLATATASTGNATTIVSRGTVRNDAWNWTPGGTIYLSTTAGGLTQTVPNTLGDKIQVIGYALDADTMAVEISPDYGTSP